MVIWEIDNLGNRVIHLGDLGNRGIYSGHIGNRVIHLGDLGNEGIYSGEDI